MIGYIKAVAAHAVKVVRARRCANAYKALHLIHYNAFCKGVISPVEKHLRIIAENRIRKSSLSGEGKAKCLFVGTRGAYEHVLKLNGEQGGAVWRQYIAYLRERPIFLFQ